MLNFLINSTKTIFLTTFILVVFNSSVYGKITDLGLNKMESLASAEMLYKQRVFITKEINLVSLEVQKNPDNVFLKTKMKNLRFSEFSIMHNIGIIRKYTHWKYDIDIVIPDSISKKFRYYTYVEKKYLLDESLLTADESFFGSEKLQENIDSLISYINIMYYDMYCYEKNGLIFLNKRKDDGNTILVTSNDYLEGFYEWVVPSYLLRPGIVFKEGRRTKVKVSYNNETNILQIY